MPRSSRTAANQSLFRAVNQEIHRLQTDRESAGTDLFEIICECRTTGCTASISITRAEYESFRRDATRFFVRAGHEQPTLETVVEDRGTYKIIQSIPSPVSRASALGT